MSTERKTYSVLHVLHGGNFVCVTAQYSGVPGGLGVQPPPRNSEVFYKVEPDCKLSGTSLVFLFQNPN